MLFIVVCWLFNSSRSLLNISCIFSFLFPRYWIIITIITLNSFSGRLPTSSSFVWSQGFLPYSFICCVFLCFLIFLNLLCLRSPFCRLQVHSSHCFWCLSPVAKVGSVGCVGFLVEGTGVCVLVEEVGSCLSGGQDYILWCVCSACDLLVILCSLSVNGWGCVPGLLVVWHRVSSTVAGHWVELGLSGEMEISGRAFAIWYYLEPGSLWWTNVLNWALPPQRHRPDTWQEHDDPVSHMAQKKREKEKKERERERERKKERRKERKKER